MVKLHISLTNCQDKIDTVKTIKDKDKQSENRGRVISD